jgi:hypothetical protein
MVTDLLHKMAHISTEADHGSAWQSEMDRIRRMGVLTYEDVQRLRKAGWNYLSASPWLPF